MVYYYNVVAELVPAKIQIKKVVKIMKIIYNKIMNAKNFIYLFTLFSLLFTNSFSRSIGRGGKPGELLTFGAGARSFGLGKSYVSIADDASASIWNPAGLYFVNMNELTALHTSLYEQTNFEFLSFAYPTIDRGTFALLLLYLSSAGFEGRDINNVVTGEFSNTQFSFGISYGNKLFKDFFAGASIKYFSNTLERSTSGNITFSIGILTEVYPKLMVGATLNNLVSLQTGEATADKLPIVLRLGGSYRMFEDQLIISLDFDTNYYGVYLGSEYKLFKPSSHQLLQSSIRAGVNVEDFFKGQTELTVGFGIGYKEYSLDYAFSTEELGGSHRLSATVRFGTSMKVAREEKEKFEMITRRNMSQKELQIGIENVQAGNFEAALKRVNKAVELYPEFEEAKSAKSKLELVTEYYKRAEDTDIGRLVKKAIEHYINNEIDLALDAFRHIIDMDPNNLTALNLAKQIAALEKRPFDIARKLDPISEKIFKARGKWFEGKYDEMATLCKEVIQIDPTNVDGLLLLGTAYYSMGGKSNIEKAIEYWKKARIYGEKVFNEKQKKQLDEEIAKAEELIK
jgi:tetratricopeptide (TPR) repeat protein